MILKRARDGNSASRKWSESRHVSKSDQKILKMVRLLSFAVTQEKKIVVAMDELTEKLSEILETIQKDMFERAKAFLDSHIHTAANMDEMVKVAQEEIGFIKAMWCGDDACEEEIKAQTGGVTSRCIPEEQEQISDVCVCCGKPAKHMVYWG